MIQGKTDPRRPDRVQRYKAPQANGNAPVEDLTPDYMNILGPESSTAGGAAAAATSASTEPVPPADDQPSPPSIPMECDANVVNNVIPTSPQYGVAIIANATNTHDAGVCAPDATSDNDANSKLLIQDAIADTVNKDVVMHTTPSRTNHINSNNDRFKVVKIATLEPFRRGRWKCMDYVDENPPVSTTAATACKASNNNVAQQQQYMQTQSLPQQHFQQMQQQFYQNLSTTGAQVQFFYPPQGATQQQATTTAFINSSGGPAQLPPGTTAGATYYQQVIPNSSGGMTLVNYPGVQYVPANLMQTQAGSAFVPTSQNMNTAHLPPNLQQSQTYAGPTSSVPTGGAQQAPTQQVPLVNGHAFPPTNPAGEQQQVTSAAAAAQQTVPVTSTLPTHAQVAKSIILGTQQQVHLQSVPGGQYNVNQQQAGTATIFQSNTSSQATPISSGIVTPSSIQPPISNQPASIATTVTTSNNNLVSASLDATSAAAAAAAVYSNPQFVASVNKIVESAVSMIDAAASNINPMQQGQQPQQNVEMQGDVNNGEQTGQTSAAASGEDTTTKANPVVNAIDNKIEQAMDLVKSHLMFTVREEVEVLKEKIAELMERIQQLESENNMLRSQVPVPKQHVLIQQQGHQQSQQTASNSNLSTDTSPSGQQQQ